MGNGDAWGKEVTLPWQESSTVSERERFIDLYLRGDHTVVELCRRFRVSRKTAYKWLRRFFDGCELVDRSRRPHSNPHAVAAWLEEAIVLARKQRPHWDPRNSTPRCCAPIPALCFLRSALSLRSSSATASSARGDGNVRLHPRPLRSVMRPRPTAFGASISKVSSASATRSAIRSPLPMPTAAT
jgi:transposase-like protein